MEFNAAIPPIASAIKVEGEEGGSVRIMLDCYLNGEQLSQILEMRGDVLTVSLEKNL